jgi:XapX domain-containing protein
MASRRAPPRLGGVFIAESVMKIYLVSLGAGLLVGLIYGFLNVRSPAPPVIALVGLLGILAGEQLPPLLRQWWQGGQGDAQKVSWIEQHVKPHCFGQLPCAKDAKNAQNQPANTPTEQS